MGQGDAVDDAGHTVAFGDVLFQELHAGRRVVEEVPDDDGGALGAAGVAEEDFFRALDLVDGADLVIGRAGQDIDPGDGGNGGQSLAAEPEGPDAVEVFLGQDLAGGMAHERVADIVPQDAGAVVGHPHVGDASVSDLHRQRSGTRVDGVLHQLFDDGRRTFDDFAGGNEVRDVFRQDIDLRHGAPPF